MKQKERNVNGKRKKKSKKKIKLIFCGYVVIYFFVVKGSWVSMISFEEN